MAPRKRTTKATPETAKAPTSSERAAGSTVPTPDRLWPHRVIDDKIAQERALGSSKRPAAVRE